ncbi:hypothetical protein ACWE42_15975 [Sutcliffiella cohnii]
MNNKYKIAKILDEYTVIINAGTEHGVELKDRFQILDNEGSAVEDPDTGETIGHLDLIKATVTVKEVYENMCVCSSPTFYRAGFFSALNNIGQAIDETYVEQEKLNIDLKDVTGGLRKSNKKVRIGDFVKLLKYEE